MLPRGVFLFILNLCFQKGTTAPQAAGRIHSDFEKGFIMAEVMHYEDFKAEGGENGCKVNKSGILGAIQIIRDTQGGGG